MLVVLGVCAGGNKINTTSAAPTGEYQKDESFGISIDHYGIKYPIEG